MLVQMKKIRFWNIGAKCSRFVLVFFFLFNSSNYSSAQQNLDHDLKFVDYLINQKMYREANYTLLSFKKPTLSTTELAALNYYNGLVAFFQNDTVTAIQSFDSVAKSSKFYNKSLIADSYCNMMKHNYLKAAIMLNEVKSSNDYIIRSTSNLLLAANSLLSDGGTFYGVYRKDVDTTNSDLYVAANNLDKAYSEKNLYKKKSPMIGGLLSAFVPGLGKWYAGKHGEAFGTLVPMVSFGLLAAESYHKGGVKSVGFLSFASLFSIFYLGNVWGSVSTVKIRNVSFEINYEKKIALNLRVSVRNLLH